MSSTITTQSQLPTAAAQSVPAVPNRMVAHPSAGQPEFAADAKTNLKADDDVVADLSTSKKTKSLAILGLQDVSAATISKMMVATGAAGLGTSLPELPTNKIPHSSRVAREAAAALPGLNSDGIMAYSAIAASEMMRQAGEKSFDAQSKAHQVSQLGQMSAQMDSALQAAKKAQADKGTAVLTFMGSAAGAFGSYGAAARGSRGPKHEDQIAPNQIRASSSTNQAQSESKDSLETSRAEARRARAAESEAGKEADEKKLEAESVQGSHAGDIAKERAAVKEHEQAIQASHEKGKETTNETQGKSDSDASHRAGIYAASAGIGQLVTSGTDAANQNFFFGKESHDADVAGKFDDVLSATYKMSEETFKTGKEKAQKIIDDAISGLKQHFDLVKSTNDRIG